LIDESVNIPGKVPALLSFNGSVNSNVSKSVPNNLAASASDTSSRRTNTQFVGASQPALHNDQLGGAISQDRNPSFMAETEYDLYHNMIFATDQPHFVDSQWDMFASSNSTHAIPDMFGGQFTDPLWAADMPFWNLGDTFNGSI